MVYGWSNESVIRINAVYLYDLLCTWLKRQFYSSQNKYHTDYGCVYMRIKANSATIKYIPAQGRHTHTEKKNVWTTESYCNIINSSSKLVDIEMQVFNKMRGSTKFKCFNNSNGKVINWDRCLVLWNHFLFPLIYFLFSRDFRYESIIFCRHTHRNLWTSNEKKNSSPQNR